MPFIMGRSWGPFGQAYAEVFDLVLICRLRSCKVLGLAFLTIYIEEKLLEFPQFNEVGWDPVQLFQQTLEPVKSQYFLSFFPQVILMCEKLW